MSKINSKEWTHYPSPDCDVETLSTKFEISPVIVSIIANRGINEASEIARFLDPSVENFDKNFCPENISIAIDRVRLAIDKKEKVLIFGDYDVDGVTGTVILVKALRQLTLDVEYYVPYRNTEGYGLNCEAIETFKDQGVSLIITVDCGISNVTEVAFANTLGIDVIVTDHHTPPVKLPEAVALINPKLEHDNYFVSLAGVGVAYKFVSALFQDIKGEDISKSLQYLELVALGTVTDVMPLLDENRIIVKNGLDCLNDDPSLGIYYLLKLIKAEHVDTRTIGFGIGPRINAAGRLDSASIAVELLITQGKTKAQELVADLNRINENRKLEGEKILQEANAYISKNRHLLEKKVLIVDAPNWAPGVIGIVASQLARTYDRPVVLMATQGETARGSMRSFAKVNIFNALEKCGPLLMNFGGHPLAAGFEIACENIETFKNDYTQLIEEQLKHQELFDTVMIDGELDFEMISKELYKELSILEPFGEANREPIFVTKNLHAIDYFKVGRDKSHLKITFTDGNERIEAICFKMAHYFPLLEDYSTFDVVYNLSLNTYFGSEMIQLRVIDLKPA